MFKAPGMPEPAFESQYESLRREFDNIRNRFAGEHASCAMISAAERRRMLAVRLCGKRVLMRLESIGVGRLVERRPDPRDARASLAFLTPRSRRFEPVAAATLSELDTPARGQLSAQRVAAVKPLSRPDRASARLGAEHGS